MLGRCRSSALPSHAAHSSGRRSRCECDFVRPIFQGLAISLMAGEVASTVLSRMTVSILYYLSQRGEPTTVLPLGNDFEPAAD
jgi:hypothetical protein